LACQTQIAFLAYSLFSFILPNFAVFLLAFWPFSNRFLVLVLFVFFPLNFENFFVFCSIFSWLWLGAFFAFFLVVIVVVLLTPLI